MEDKRPEIANQIQTGFFKTNYHDIGNGDPVLLLHGSGPGVTAWANWGKLFPLLAPQYRLIAPDLAGFGFTEREENPAYTLNKWTQQVLDLLDMLKIEKVNIVGNSFGGALAMALAIQRPNRVRRLVLMGSMGISFPLTYGLDKVWGYTPSLANMRELLDIFTYDHSFAGEELARSRYEASKQPGFQESFASMFPEPRQQYIESMAVNQQYIRDIPHETLIVHGREDQVIPLENAYRLMGQMRNAQLHIFGKCGHWTQIERRKEFAALLRNFFK